MIQRIAMKSAVLAIAFALSLAAHASADELKTVSVPPGDLGKALRALADQVGVEFVYQSYQVRGLHSGGVSGEYSARDAVIKLLEGTQLQLRADEDSGALLITRPAALRRQYESPETSRNNISPDQVRVAQNTGGSPNTDPGSTGQSQDIEETADIPGLERVVVTGTSIRGVEAPASPLTVLTADEISESGAATLYEALARLSTNFRGGVFENSQLQLSPSRDSNLNSSFGSGVNLRGLGNTSTLVLVNGHRVAPGGFASFVDISSIPVSAVERVEILTDGASATYGADAVAGVVNIILRQKIEEPETRLRIGGADGGATETAASQAFGTNWKSGSAYLIYDYYKRDPLDNSDRRFAESSDLTRFGGDNFGSPFSHPGNILDFTGSPLLGIPAGQDGTELTVDDLLDTPNIHNIKEGGELIPGQERHALTAQFNQQIGTNLALHATALYSERDYEAARLGLGTVLFVTAANPYFLDATGSGFDLLGYSFFDDIGALRTAGTVEQITAAAGFDYQISDWVLDLSATYADSSEESRTDNWVNFILLSEALGNFSNPSTSYDPLIDGFFNPYGAGDDNSPGVLNAIRGFLSAERQSTVKSIGVRADGPLLELGSGSLIASIGVEARNELYKSGGIDFAFSPTPTPTDPTDIDRDVKAVYGEILIPLTSRNSRPGSIDLSIAARAEDYSDFGTTTNPKVGIVWKPTGDWAFRLSYGSSFRAPILSDMDPNQRQVIATFFADPASPTGSSLGILLAGNNPELEPEEAKTFTVTAEYRPERIEDLLGSISFYDVEYEERISQAPDGFAILLDPTVFADLIERDPDLATVNGYLNDPVLENFTGLPVNAEDVSVIVDGRLRNLSRTSISGVDLTLERGWTQKSGVWTAGLEGTYRFDHKEQFSRQAPVVEQLGTVYHPPEWIARGWLRFGRGPVSTVLSVNYTDSFQDTLSTPSRSVESWTTADLQFAYLPTAATPSLISGLEVRATIRNIFDDDPPFVNNPAGIGFDPDNASPLGRFLSIEFAKRW
ncbi:MAG: TonB-dependent receptor domain-containing protein [Steroidobacteraceae bacterium]